MSNGVTRGVATRYESDLRAGEKLTARYSCDVALCRCEPVSSAVVDTIPVAQGTAPDGTQYDRCLLCGTCWTRKRWRDCPSEVIADPGRSIAVPAVNKGSLGGRSSRTLEIERLLGTGLKNVEIARRLGVKPQEVAHAAYRARQRARSAA